MGSKFGRREMNPWFANVPETIVPTRVQTQIEVNMYSLGISNGRTEVE